MNISSWLNTTVSVKTRTGVAATGNPSYSTSSSVAARVDKKTKAIPNADGERLLSQCMVTVLGEITTEDQIQLPGESVWRRAIVVDEGQDKHGNITHYEVWL